MSARRFRGTSQVAVQEHSTNGSSSLEGAFAELDAGVTKRWFFQPVHPCRFGGDCCTARYPGFSLLVVQS